MGFSCKWEAKPQGNICVFPWCKQGSSVLLGKSGSWNSCGCHLSRHHLPKHSTRPSTPTMPTALPADSVPLSRTTDTANSQTVQEWPKVWAHDVDLASTFTRSQSDRASVRQPGTSPTHSGPMGRGGVHVLQWRLSGVCVSSGFHMNAWNMFPSRTMPVTRLSMLFTSPVSGFILWLISVDSHEAELLTKHKAGVKCCSRDDFTKMDHASCNLSPKYTAPVKSSHSRFFVICIIFYTVHQHWKHPNFYRTHGIMK